MLRSLSSWAQRELILPPPGEAGPTLMPGHLLTSYVGCDKPKTVMDVSGSCNPKALHGIQMAGRPVAVHGWRCFEDVPSKPGWISTVEHEGATAATHEVEFRMDLTRRGTLTVGFLRSYSADMGKASVFLKGLPQYAVELDGAWESHTSQDDLRTIPVHRLLPPGFNESSMEVVEGVQAKVGSPCTVVVRALPPPQGITMNMNTSAPVLPRSKFKLHSLTSC